MQALADVLQLIFGIYQMLLLIRILLSWAPMAGIRIDDYNPMIVFLRQVTDVVLEPFRRLIPPIGGMDFSPMIAMLSLSLISDIVVQTLRAA